MIRASTIDRFKVHKWADFLKMDEFEIPDQADARVLETSLEEHEIVCQLEECKQELMLKGLGTLDAWFSVLNLVIRKFSDLSNPTRELCWNIVLSELKLHTNGLTNCDILQLEPRKKKTLRNCTKILCFTAVSLANEFESEIIHRNSKEKKGRCAVDSFPWDEERLKLLLVLVRLSDLQLVQLWEPPSISIMEDLATLFASICYKFLENPTVARDKVLLDNISALLGATLQKHGLTLSASLKLVQLLQHFEHLVIPISNIVVLLATKYSCKQLVLDVFREICSMDPSDLVMDSSGTKSFASFQVLVSGQIPALVLPAMPVLLPHLNGESTTFRNGVLGVLGELLKLLDVSSDGGLLPDTRDQMLMKLIDHLHDVNAFVRAKALNILLQLCSGQGIPLPLLQMLLEKVMERLKDKSSLVRKNALQLLGAVLSSNPFAAKLDREEFTRRLAEERAGESSSDESIEHVAVIQYLQAGLDFTTLLSRCVPLAVEMMRSKVVSDVLESVEFLCVARQFWIDGAQEAVSKSLALVWSQDERLRNAVVSAYVRLYLTSDTHSKQKDHAQQVVRSLLKIASTATLGELASLEKLVGLLTCKGHIPALAIKELWQTYHKSNCEKSPLESVLSCQLLSMVICADSSSSSVSSNLDHMMSSGLLQLNDLLVAKSTCSAINKLMQSSGQGVRLPNDHSIFNQIAFVLTSNFKNLETSQWIPLCEQGVTLVYQLSEQPNAIGEVLLRDLSQLTNLEGGINSVVLSRLLFCAGHIAQCQVIHCELNIVKERKRLKMLNSETNIQGELEEELGIGGGDEQEADFVRKVMETEVGAGGMLAAFEPLIVCVVSNPSKYNCDVLQSTAALSLSKFMLISSTLCEKYLQLFFTVLEKSLFSTVRANLIIAASDLVCRFPNIIEPWTPFLYGRLEDDSDLVRKNTMMVLTHLILNDMIKIRGQISAMALCLEDTTSNIVELAQVFFNELSQKGNNLYNVLPDIISQLTNPDNSTCSQKSFQNIVRYLFKLIKKEKHHESLMEKLCHRLRAVRTEQQAQDIAFCLSLFLPTEKGLLKMHENLPCYQDKLCNEVVHKHLLAYVSRARKMVKPEIKALGEELERKMCEVLNMDGTATGMIECHGSPRACDSPAQSFKGDALTAARKTFEQAT